MLPRTIYQEDHEIFRRSVQRFIDDEIQPYHAQWEKDGIVSREVWRKAGAAGLLCCSVRHHRGICRPDLMYYRILLRCPKSGYRSSFWRGVPTSEPHKVEWPRQTIA